MRFELAHPTDPHLRAEYGFDPTPLVQWFVETFRGSRAKPLAIYDAMQRRYDHKRPLSGALAFLVEQAFLSHDDVTAALEAFAAPSPVRLPKSARRALEVIENFKAAAE